MTRGWAAILVLMPGSALACALPPSVILTLPTGHYITAAALTVAVTAALGLWRGALPQPGRRAIGLPRAPGAEALGATLLSLAGTAGLFALLYIGWLGAEDPLHNLLTLVFWTGVWIALPFACLLFGDVWRPISPWRGVVRLGRAALGWQGRIGLSRLQAWPAVLGMAGFMWFQIVSLSPEDPQHLGQVLLIYWLVILALALAEGEDWLDQGEFLTRFFASIARIAPLGRDGRGQLWLGLPGHQIAAMGALGVSEMAFVIVTLGGLSFEGLSETFAWMGLVGQNPLEFAGRSAVMGVNTLGLAAMMGVTFAAIAGALWLGRVLGGAGFATGPVMVSFLAIAAGYHLAHYLVTLLTTGQYTLLALNDPLFRGDALLGMEPYALSFGFLAEPASRAAIYGVQFAAILGAHVLAVVLTLRRTGQPVRALGHLPMTGLMVGYTVFGLWLLSTARISA